MRSQAWAAVAGALVCLACGGGATDDAGRPPDGHVGLDAGPEICAADTECDDNLFCNGTERCDPGAGPSCVAGTPPCVAVCDEARDVCGAASCDDPAYRDFDGDGVARPECGGADCDDNDNLRNPSRVEVCDPDDRDEDCNSATFGELDDDNDSYFSAECCNGSTCGDDCDDARADVNPGLPEVCTDGVDNNCNGLVDDGGAVIRCFRDRDGDGFGRSVEFTDFCGGCPVGWASAMGDCEDDVARANPGADFQTGTYIDSDAFDRPTGDWNCDMREETRWRQPITQACGFDTLGDCTGEWWESAAVGPGPSCGATGTYLTCAGTRRDGCYTNAAVRMQECR